PAIGPVPSCLPGVAVCPSGRARPLAGQADGEPDHEGHRQRVDDDLAGDVEAIAERDGEELIPGVGEERPAAGRLAVDADHDATPTSGYDFDATYEHGLQLL